MKDFAEFKKILDKIENSPGHKIDSSARLLEISFKLMTVNFVHLKKFIQHVPLFSSAQKDSSEEFQIEALRLFVNFLNSAVAFKDHIRNYVRAIYGDPKTALGGSYQAKIETEFANDPLTGFIEAMRNTHDHQKVIPIGLQTTFPHDTPLTKVILAKKDLLSDYSLDSKAQPFLDQGTEDIDVLSVSEDYINKTLFPWLMTQQSIAHKKEFDDLKELRKQAAKLLKD